jgi:hypothetical protein
MTSIIFQENKANYLLHLLNCNKCGYISVVRLNILQNVFDF